MKTSVATLLLLGLVGATGTWLTSAVPDAASESLSAQSALPVSTLVLEPLTSIVRNRQFTGVVTARIRHIIAQVDPTTRTQTVVLDIDTPFVNQLADGRLIRLNFEETQELQGFRVPLSALASASRGLWTVYVVETESEESNQHVVKSRTVEVLHTDGDHAVIRGAVYAGERIVPEGVHRVTPGQVVQP